MYANEDLRREGFDPCVMSRRDFVEMFCRTHRVTVQTQLGDARYPHPTSRPCEPSDEVTRIEFEYVDAVAQEGAA